MITKIISLTGFMLIACILITCNTMAQQLQSANAENSAKQTAVTTGANYTYKIFQAPDRMFGYDIFCNGKIIFHQPALIVQPKNNSIAAIAKKEHAEKAALLAIEKIKKNEPATLTQQEIKKIVQSVK